jgi:DNA polymerase
MQDAQSDAALTALLDWYRAIGVDEAVGEMAVDWRQRGDAAPGSGFRLSGLPQRTEGAPTPATRAGRPSPGPQGVAGRTTPAPVRPASQLHAPRSFPTAAPDAAVMAARAAAREAATLDELGATLAAFDGCGLKATAKNLCFYRGVPKARLMLIGEAPGRDEDLEGKPFVGRAGQLLDKMLGAVLMSEADVHITNIVYWRPPGNRTPTPQEAQVCRPFLERQVELVSPELIVLLGGAAAKHVLDVAEGIMRIRGKLREVEIGSHKVRAMATLHPAYLLRTPAAKRLAWRDLLAVKAALGG